jgi:undecaprenyl-diphosphatase
MTTAEAIILAIVEGLTEYIPVSSTGHLIIAESFLQMKSSAFNRMYIINIQFGAILAVVLLYWRRFFHSFDFYLKLFVAFLPAAILGKLLNDYIDHLLESVFTVAISMIVGGVFLLFSDYFFKSQMAKGVEENPENPVIPAENEDTFLPIADDKPITDTLIEIASRRENISFRQSFIIGLFQAVAMIPGVSRSAATIFGGLTQRLTIRDSAEFSFLLAVPTIFAAALYKTYKNVNQITASDMDLLLVGNLVSFIVAALSIKLFLSVVNRYGLKIFGIYRIVFGTILLILFMMGFNLNIVG